MKYPKGYGLDKIFHALTYGGLALSCLFAFSPRYFRTKRLWINLGIIFFCLIYNIADEVHQAYIPARISSPWDVVAGFTGSLIVVGLWQYKKQKTMPLE